ncbi:MAG: metallophosphoesterase [Patescibacteria group bacterium]|jgi:predicted MPP superfamily phosphohydrolase|nr:metallophosphoesterase [Patescibacteria group bacterium]
MVFKFISFFGIAIIILIVSNIPIYLALVKFFSIEKKASKHLLFYSLPLLAVSFILASLLIHKYDNLFTKTFYYISSLWMGMMVSLLIFSILGFIIYFSASILKINVNLSYLAYLIIFLSFIWFGFSYLNARHPVVKNIEVKIKNLPSTWEGKTIVQLSDIHIGIIHGKKYMDYIATLVDEINPDLVLITGDLFDGAGDDIEHSILPINKVVPEYGIYYITGNHETYLGVDKSLNALKNTKIIHLPYKTVNLDGLQLTGVDYPAPGKAISLDDIFDKIDKNVPSIVMTHEPIKIDYFKNTGTNLQLAGHTHHGQMFPFNFFTKIIYRGYDYGLFTDGAYNLYTTSGAGTWGPPLRSFGPSEIVAIKVTKE